MPVRSGEAGIRTPDTGLIPYSGLANRSDLPASHSPPDTSGDDQKNLAVYLALLAKKSLDLALTVERWDSLPEAVRAGIMAMVRAAGGYGD